MAMEFGDSHELPGAPEPAGKQVEEVEEVEVVEIVEEAEAPVAADYSGGFELVDESAPASPPAASLSDEAPTFDEEPVVFGGAEEEPEVVTLSLDGVEEPVSDFTGEDIVVGAEEPEEEVQVIELDVESEPALAADGAESLIGALGEDIDSLIDSIIDDIGSSAKGAEPAREPPPTHIPLFSDLTTSEFIAVALLLVRRVAKVGEVIVREGDPGDSMFIVSTGEVRATVLRSGQQLPVATMRDGDFFGEMAVLTGEPRTATVTAVKSTELLELSREHLSEICARHPEVEAKIRLAYDERVSRR
jgi:hypothetical protein